MPHIVRDMGVDVQRGGCGHMAQHGRKGLQIHAVLQRQGGERMPIEYNKDKSEKSRKIK